MICPYVSSVWTSLDPSFAICFPWCCLAHFPCLSHKIGTPTYISIFPSRIHDIYLTFPSLQLFSRFLVCSCLIATTNHRLKIPWKKQEIPEETSSFQHSANAFQTRSSGDCNTSHHNILELVFNSYSTIIPQQKSTTRLSCAGSWDILVPSGNLT